MEEPRPAASSDITGLSLLLGKRAAVVAADRLRKKVPEEIVRQLGTRVLGKALPKFIDDPVELRVCGCREVAQRAKELRAIRRVKVRCGLQPSVQVLRLSLAGKIRPIDSSSPTALPPWNTTATGVTLASVPVLKLLNWVPAFRARLGPSARRSFARPPSISTRKRRSACQTHS